MVAGGKVPASYRIHNRPPGVGTEAPAGNDQVAHLHPAVGNTDLQVIGVGVDRHDVRHIPALLHPGGKRGVGREQDVDALPQEPVTISMRSF